MFSRQQYLPVAATILSLTLLATSAYADNNKHQEAAFFATAVKIGDEIAVDGIAPTYMVEWEIIDHDTEDDGNACDWDNPISITDYSDVDVD